jgi:hypothetical protein
VDLLSAVKSLFATLDAHERLALVLALLVPPTQQPEVRYLTRVEPDFVTALDAEQQPKGASVDDVLTRSTTCTTSCSASRRPRARRPPRALRLLAASNYA